MSPYNVAGAHLPTCPNAGHLDQGTTVETAGEYGPCLVGGIGEPSTATNPYPSYFTKIISRELEKRRRASAATSRQM
jgi:hypothetical protein